MTTFPEPPTLTFLASLSVDVGAPIDVGVTPEGHRRIIPIIGGTVSGPGLSGRVLPAGADFQILRSAELTELDARYALELDDGSVVFVHNVALRFGSAEDIARLNRGEDIDPALIYFRCTPRFSTSAPGVDWLNHVITVGTGRRRPGSVEIDVFTVT
ncbi:Protein of unknown function [Arthrobacter sp. yr096]|uniref:DUF3237 domain-containing protein n=1 Tax=Arthrobacter sp. yr096 TaxID=1761750 RepID=UPI0008C4092B|nr:DUF3237 domain-containing protein [Arthrobacter sp. yr096]SEI84653.1 Protein of unknown function [Arthrobacter sp. yr096]